MTMLDGTSLRTAHARDAAFADAIQECSFQREGKPHVEFHVRLVSYPKRETLQKAGLPNSLLNHFMGEGGNGFYVELIHRRLRKHILVKFKYLPYIEIHMTRSIDAPFLDDSVVFPRSDKDETLAAYMRDQLLLSKGDPSAYVEVMMKFYQRVLLQRNSKFAATQKKGPIQAKDAISIAIEEESRRENVTEFANMVDNDYMRAMEDAASNWVTPTSELIPKS